MIGFSASGTMSLKTTNRRRIWRPFKKSSIVSSSKGLSEAFRCKVTWFLSEIRGSRPAFVGSSLRVGLRRIIPPLVPAATCKAFRRRQIKTSTTRNDRYRRLSLKPYECPAPFEKKTFVKKPVLPNGASSPLPLKVPFRRGA